jgi:hypothetical protein
MFLRDDYKPGLFRRCVRGERQKRWQCSHRLEELIGLDYLDLSAKCGAFSSRGSYAYGKNKVERFTYLIGLKPEWHR